MTRSLLDRWCPEPHAAPVTALAFDPASRLSASADAQGLVAVYPAKPGAPLLLLRHAAGVQGALAISRDGKLLAVGDESGTIAVYRLPDGKRVWSDERPGPAGAARAMRAAVFSPDGKTLATLSADGRIRLTALDRKERLDAFPDFSGGLLDWDPSGTWILALDASGQPTLVQRLTRQKVGLPLVSGRTLAARFTPDGRHALLLSTGGITLVDVHELEVRNARTADKSSGNLDLVLAPDGQRFAVVSTRSVHYFQLDGLRHVGKQRHSATTPTGRAVWDEQGVAVAGDDGRLHRPEVPPPLPATVCAAGVGVWRVSGHDHHVTLWSADKRVRTFIPQVNGPGPEGDGVVRRALLPDELLVEAAVDREGRILALLPEGLPLHVYDASDARLLFDAGADTAGTPRVEVSVGVVAALLADGGLRWFDLRGNRTLELAWVEDFALTSGGTWIAVLTPQGRVRVLDPRSGEPVPGLPTLAPFGTAPARVLAFVHRKPELLVLDEEGILGLYDLTPAARDGQAPAAWRIVQFRECEVDALWGLADGKHAVARVQEPDDGTATLVTVDLDRGEVVHEVKGCVPYITVDASTGRLIEPGYGNAILERQLDGKEARVLRSLPRGEWVSFEERRVIAESSGAGVYGPARADAGKAR